MQENKKVHSRCDDILPLFYGDTSLQAACDTSITRVPGVHTFVKDAPPPYIPGSPGPTFSIKHGDNTTRTEGDILTQLWNPLMCVLRQFTWVADCRNDGEAEATTIRSQIARCAISWGGGKDMAQTATLVF